MTFKANPKLEVELEAELRASGALLPAAQKAADRATGLAHSAMPRKGHRPIEVGEVDGDVAIVNTNHGGHLEEFGLAYTPEYAPLRRGARAAGLDLRES
jgi:hypothetical protein